MLRPALVFAFSLVLLPVADGQAQGLVPPNSRVLIGLKTFKVIVGSFGATEISDGVDSAAIRNKVELEARKVGITLSDSASAVIFVNLNYFLPKESSLYTFHKSLHVYEVATLDRNATTKVLADTWESGTLGVVGKNNVRNAAMDSAVELIEEFLNDWLKANPKKP